MSRVLLCTGKYAEKPYRFNSLGINVYCVEELCYLFASNPFMINAGIMDKELAEWIDRECGLTELSHQLLLLFRKGSQPSAFVDTILDYVNYCTGDEKKKLEEILAGSAGLNEYERRKQQGDYLLQNHRYLLAVEAYEGLCLELPETESALKPALYHNMGVAYAGFFLFEAAAKYFRRAYEMTGKEESGLQYLSALRLHLREDAYVAFVAEHPEYHDLSLKIEKNLSAAKEMLEATEENRMLSTLRIYKEEGNATSYYEEIDKIIADLKDGYRKLVEE